MAKFTNISNGPRGLHTTSGLVMVEAGADFDGNLAEGEEPAEEWFAKAGSKAAKEAVADADPLDHDGDGRKGGHVDGKKT